MAVYFEGNAFIDGGEIENVVFSTSVIRDSVADRFTLGSLYVDNSSSFSGGVSMFSGLSMNDTKITDLLLPTSGKDAVNVEYLDMRLENFLTIPAEFLELTIGSLTVSGESKFREIVNVENGLTVTGGSTFTNDLQIQDGLIVTGGSTFTNDLYIEGGLTVTGGSTFTKDLNIQDGLIVTGGSTFTNDLQIQDGLIVTGGSTFTNDLYIEGGLTVTGGSTFTNDLNIKEGLTVIGGSTFLDILNIENGLTVTGGSTFTNDLNIEEGLTVTGGSTFLDILNIENGLVVTGGSTFTNDLNIQHDLSVTGGSSFLSDIDLNQKVIYNLGDPTAGNHAVNLDYLENYLKGELDLSQITSGSLTVTGGSSFLSDIDLNQRVIYNLGYPTAGNHAVNLDYLENYLKGELDLSQITTGSLTVTGGSSFLSDVDLNQKVIYNLGVPTAGNHAVNLDYLENYLKSELDLSQITTGSLTVTGGSSFLSDIDLNQKVIYNLGDPTAGNHAVNLDYLENYLTSELDLSQITTGSLTVTGGSSFLSDIDLNQKVIYNLGDPTAGNHAVNLDYLENYLTSELDLSQITIGNLTVTSGSSFLSNIDLNNNIIKNVNYPSNSFDVANKAYVDELFEICCNGTSAEDTGIKLLPNISEPKDILELSYSNTLKAFVTHIYIKFNSISSQNINGITKCCLATVRGIRLSDTWYINTIFKGEPIGVRFYSKSNNGGMVLQYTNSNTEDSTTIEFETVRRVTVLDDLYQKYYSLQPTNGEFVKLDSSIGDMYFDKNIYDAVEIIAHVSDINNIDYGLYFIVGMIVNNIWNFHIYSIGTATPDISFKINTSGELQYTNTSNIEYNVQLRTKKIWKSFNSFTLFKNTHIKTDIDNSLWIKESETNYIEFYIYAFVEETGECALYDIDSYYCKDRWITNIKFYGDILDIEFYIESSNNYAILKYKNTKQYDVKIRYISSPNTEFQQEPYLPPNAVLRGNGFDNSIATLDFIYKDNVLILGEESSILIKNTEPATNSTDGNTFTTLGGVNIQKNLIVGDQIIVNNINITPSKGDINKEHIFYANNNQTIPEDITDFKFDNNLVKTFDAMVSVSVNFINGQEYIGLYTLRGINKQTGWFLNINYIGDNTGFQFVIDTNGQIQYTSSNLSNWDYTVICFRALTTSVV